MLTDTQIADPDQQLRMYQAALDSTPDFFYVFDLEHRALYANEALVKVWGVGDVRGKKWMDLGYEQWHAEMHVREIDVVRATRQAADIRCEFGMQPAARAAQGQRHDLQAEPLGEAFQLLVRGTAQPELRGQHAISSASNPTERDQSATSASGVSASLARVRRSKSMLVSLTSVALPAAATGG